ncbi:MAG: YegP family protein [Oscillospiraceae bacterium]|nr:YegP family protein [Oscillospiraceae bacterium]
MGKFVVNMVKSGSYRFCLKAGNGEIIAVSENYTSLDACKNGMESVRKNCGAHIEDQTVAGFEELKHPKYEIYKDKKGEFRFRLKASNGEIILASEGYTAKASCKNGIESVAENAPKAEYIQNS